MTELKLNNIPNNIVEFETVYDLLAKFVKSKYDRKLRQRVMLAYSLIVMDYLVKKENARWEFIKRFEIYNSYNEPFVVVDGEDVSVLGNLVATLRESKGNFRFFKAVTGLK